MPHVNQGGFRQSLMLGGDVPSPEEKSNARKQVLQFILKNTSSGDRILTFPGSWDFERALLSRRPKMNVVAVEHNQQIVTANLDRMPGGVPQEIKEEIDGSILKGYRTNNSRIAVRDFGKFIQLRFGSDSAIQQEAFAERWLYWDAAWIDMCSNLAPKSIEDLAQVRYACQIGKKIPIAVTATMGRESDREIMSTVNELGGGVIGRVNMIAAALGNVVKQPEYFTYVTRNGNGVSRMLVTLMVLKF